jgi:CBS domain-containing protein
MPQKHPRRSPRSRVRRQVREVMRRDFVTVPAHASLGEAIRIMRLARMRHLLVERNGVLVGLLSYRDLQDRALEDRSRDPAPLGRPDVAVEAAMVDSPYAVSPDAPLSDAASRMCRFRVGCLPVVEASDAGPRLVGLLTEADLLQAAYLAR